MFSDKLTQLTETTGKLVVAVEAMASWGVRIDRPYVLDNMSTTEALARSNRHMFKEMTGREFVNSSKELSGLFDEHGIKYLISKKGNPLFNAPCLYKYDMPHELRSLILAIRRDEKLVSTYYKNYIKFSDEHDILRPTYLISKAKTGRFTCENPNFQNIPREESGAFDDEDVQGSASAVRACFIPREGYKYVAIDYAQQELRILIDYAGDHELIEAVLEGKSIHQETASRIGVDKNTAKQFNFGVVYGGGPAKIAEITGKPLKEIKLAFERFKREMHKVMDFKYKLQRAVAHRGYVVNWAGRILPRPPATGAYGNGDYKILNHLIQSSGADVIRKAIVQSYEYIVENKLGWRLAAQIHDELLFEVPEDELDILPEIVDIMRNVYTPFNGMTMDVEVNISDKSFAKKDFKVIKC